MKQTCWLFSIIAVENIEAKIQSGYLTITWKSFKNMTVNKIKKSQFFSALNFGFALTFLAIKKKA
jgi:hypothetical protein